MEGDGHTWETCVLILVPGRSLGKSLSLWAKEGEAAAASEENNLLIITSSLHVGIDDEFFFNKLLKAAIYGGVNTVDTS